MVAKNLRILRKRWRSPEEMLANGYPWSRLAFISARIFVCHYEDQ